jgi:hypothetical protein
MFIATSAIYISNTFTTNLVISYSNHSGGGYMKSRITFIAVLVTIMFATQAAANMGNLPSSQSTENLSTSNQKVGVLIVADAAAARAAAAAKRDAAQAAAAAKRQAAQAAAAAKRQAAQAAAAAARAAARAGAAP